jgi:2-dehydropantoate 2-reductase
MRLAVLGAGGVGGFLAAALERAGNPVLVVAREATAELIARQGIEVSSERLGAFTARPRATSHLEEPVDVLIVATKSTGLQAAMERVRAEPQLTVPLLNGLDHLPLLRERLRGPVAAGAIRIESTRTAPGRIEHTSPFLRVDMASVQAPVRASLTRLAQSLEAAGVPARVLESEAQVMWSKLVRLNALACTTSATGLTLGAIRSDPSHRATLEAAVAEAAAVARAEGARLEAATVMDELDDAHDTLNSSMARDIEADRRPELDAIAGAVLRAGARHGLACPTIERLAGEVAARAGVAPPAAIATLQAPDVAP